MRYLYGLGSWRNYRQHYVNLHIMFSFLTLYYTILNKKCLNLSCYQITLNILYEFVFFSHGIIMFIEHIMNGIESRD